MTRIAAILTEDSSSRKTFVRLDDGTNLEDLLGVTWTISVDTGAPIITIELSGYDVAIHADPPARRS